MSAGPQRAVVLFAHGSRDPLLRLPVEAVAGDSSVGSSGEPDPWLRGVSGAPVLVVCLSDPDAYLDRYAEPDKGWTDRDEARWPVPYWHVDTGMAALLILQTAVDEGLGACFFGIPPDRDQALRTTFGIPDDHDPVGAITIGHRAEGGAAGSPSRRGRRPTADLVHRNGW